MVERHPSLAPEALGALDNYHTIWSDNRPSSKPT